MSDASRRAVEEVARASYGRLLAFLCSRVRDVAAAEDALSDALLAALATWPRDGVPHRPEAWLLTAARRRLADQARRAQVRAEHEPTLRSLAAEVDRASRAGTIPDQRLRLLFVCAHPAIDRALHAPLMLQVGLGLDAARIAQAFLVQPATMGQRLSRAKRKIREARISFDVPADDELPARLASVLDALYAAFGIAWDGVHGAQERGAELADEALWLARVLREQLPDEPEVRGLLALFLFCRSRQEARRASDGGYVPLSEQDPARWSAADVATAEAELRAASAAGRPGRFQLEAAIQSVHADRARTGRIDWAAIELLYEGLLQCAPALGAAVAQAAAAGEARGPDAGLLRLDRIAPASVADYQPYWAVRAELLHRLGRGPEARAAYERALELVQDPAVRSFLTRRRG